ncbi:hypothetical protein IAT40_007418 [Kwoniella sp. CBS 6097]
MTDSEVQYGPFVSGEDRYDPPSPASEVGSQGDPWDAESVSGANNTTRAPPDTSDANSNAVTNPTLASRAFESVSSAGGQFVQTMKNTVSGLCVLGPKDVDDWTEGAGTSHARQAGNSAAAPSGGVQIMEYSQVSQDAPPVIGYSQGGGEGNTEAYDPSPSDVAFNGGGPSTAAGPSDRGPVPKDHIE